MSSSDNIIKITGPVVLIGDVHGHFSEELYSLFSTVTNLPIKSGNVIVLGDVGLGFSIEGTDYFDVCMETCESLGELGWHVYLIRGNHDNPKCWDGPNRDYVTFLKDNTVIEINGLRYFVTGGGTSIDRCRRVEDRSWWRDESLVVPSLQVLHSVGPIHGILSHVGPAPGDLPSNPVPYYMAMDRGLEVDLELERIQLERLVSLRPEVWYFGHYHVTRTFPYKGIECHALGELSTELLLPTERESQANTEADDR